MSLITLFLLAQVTHFLNHEQYIKRCIEIGKNGIGTTRPNPAVGAVLVLDDKVIGEGFTNPYGGSHAEVNAIGSVKDKELLKKATMYVTLEPCSHYGKTPPCSDLIIRNEIPRVVIGCLDSNSLVAGRGIKRMRSAGVEVEVGVLEKECREHHKRFFTFHEKQRPYVILKWAETSNGFIAPKFKDEKKPVWITNNHSRQIVHEMRAKEHAILVGYNTVEQDNPSLTVRDADGLNPIRVVLDTDYSLSKDYQVFNDESETIVLNETEPNKILNKLFESDIQSVIIEGGAKTLQNFIDKYLWDEAFVFSSNITFSEGVLAPKLSGRFISEENIAGDILKKYTND